MKPDETAILETPDSPAYIQEYRTSLEAHLSALDDATLDLVMALSPHGTIVYLNRAFADLTGFRREEHLGKSFVGLLHHDDMSPAIDAFDRVGRGEPAGPIRLRMRTALAGFRPLLVLISPIRSRGKMDGALAIGRDTTEADRIEARLRELEAYTEAANDALCSFTRSGRVCSWNRAAERLFGWSAKEMRHTHILETIGGADPEGFKASVESVRAGGWCNNTLKLQTRDERTRVAACRFSVVASTESESIILMVATDAAGQWPVEEEKSRVHRSEIVGRMASGISHNLNDVFSSLLLCIDAIRTARREDEVTRAIGALEDSANRGARLVRQLSAFSLGEGDEKAVVSPSDILSDIREVVGETFPKSITVEVASPVDVWDLYANRWQIQQALIDACLMSRDAIPRGGTIVVTADNIVVDESYASMQKGAKPGRYVCFVVADVGRDTEIAASASEVPLPPFHQSESSRVQSVEMGSIAALAIDHAGFVVTRSEPARGMQICVYLPALNDEIYELQDNRGEAEEEEAEGKGHVVLIVDDEPTIREITKATLELHGYNVLTATDGAKAVSTFAENVEGIDAVVTDIIMPYMNGSTAIRALRQLRSDIPVIATSGAITRGQLLEQTDEENVVFLPKPFSAEDLLRTLRAVLKNSDQGHSLSEGDSDAPSASAAE